MDRIDAIRERARRYSEAQSVMDPKHIDFIQNALLDIEYLLGICDTLLAEKPEEIPPPNLRPIPEDAEHMTLDDFINEVASGFIFDDTDGTGYYATETQMTDLPICPSDVVADNLNREFTHVVWFNK